MMINNDLLKLRDAYFELNNNISKDKVISHLPSSFRIKVTSDSLKLHSSVASTPRSDLKRAIHELAIETLDQESVDNINNFFGSFYRCAGVKNTGDCNWSEHHYKDIDRMDVFFQAIGQVFQRVEERPSALAQILQEFTARVSNLLHIRPIHPEKQLVDAIIGLLDSDLSQAVQALNLLSEEHKTRLSSHFNIYKNNPQYGSVSEPDIFEKKGSAKFKAEVIADFLLCNPDILNSHDMQKTVKKIFCDWFDSQYIKASKRLGLPCPSSQEEECLGKFIYNMEKGLDERAQRYFSLLSNSLQQQMTDFCKKRLGNSFSFSTALDDSRTKEGKISALVYFIRNETISGKNELLNNMRMLNVWSDTVR
ncbi:MAG: hypothetical protein FJZ57_07830, partial [Chlamydiae bacterium]|nr:hypothetical protein [Chlamydiota bacterium]